MLDRRVRALAALLLLAAAAQPPDAAGDPLARGEALAARRDWAGARDAWLEAVQDGSVAARVKLAEALLELGDVQGARAELDRAQAGGIAPDRLRLVRGRMLLALGRAEEAQAQFAGAADAGGRAEALRWLGAASRLRGDGATARAAYDRALALAPQDAALWVEIARFRDGTGDRAGAIAALDRALALAPGSVEALVLRGRFLAAQFGPAAALPWYERALAAAPADVEALAARAAALGDSGRARDSLAAARELIKRDPGNATGFYLQAVIAARAGRHDLARRLLRRAGDLPDRMPGAMLVAAVADMGAGNHGLAAERLKRLVARQPYNQKARLLLARALQQAGRHAEAWDAVAPLASRDDASDYAATLGARLLESLGRGAEALPLLERAAPPGGVEAGFLWLGSGPAAFAAQAEANPGDAGAVIPYVRALVAAGEGNAALAAAERLRAANPGAADAHMLVGDLRLGLGDAGSARDAYAKAREIAFSAPLMLRLVEASVRTGDQPGARAVLADYLRWNPGHVEAQRLLAGLWLEAGGWDQAAGLLGAVAARLGPNDALLGAARARALIGAGRGGEAVRIARLAHDAQPANPLASYVWGLALADAGRARPDARALLEKAESLAPGNPEVAEALARLGPSR